MNSMMAFNFLAITYAFPPTKVPMAFVCFKQLVALSKLGSKIDVLTVFHDENFFLHRDESLSNLVDISFETVIRLKKKYCLDKFSIYKLSVFEKLTDAMVSFNATLFDYLMSVDLSRYDAIISFSPFHSINHVISTVKKYRNFYWVAHFCDPWHRNPLEKSVLKKFGNWISERKFIKNCDRLVHSAQYSLDLMRVNNKHIKNIPSIIIPHGYLYELFPKRPKLKNKKIIIRHIGTLFDQRSPEWFFKALKRCAEKNNHLSDLISIELIGKIEKELLETESFYCLPKDLVKVLPSVDYIKSLELMYDADVLLLIEGDAKKSLFFPSKLADYIGADTPIIGLVPDGISRDILESFGYCHAPPTDIESITKIIEMVITDFLTINSENLINRKNFDLMKIFDGYTSLIEHE